MRHSRIFRAFVTALALASLSHSAFGEQNEGRRLATLAFKSTDLNSDGVILLGEYRTHAGYVFVGMDEDENDSLTMEEFGFWGFGMLGIAEQSGRTQAYETARKVVFDLWDRSFDWEVSFREFNNGITDDFKQADYNGDEELTEDEYLKYSIINITLRSALRSTD